MHDELAAIDTAAISELSELRQEQNVLQERLAKMEEMREKVSEAVFQKVHDDYEFRLSALDHETRPLRDAAIEQFRALRKLYSGLQASLDAARLDKEELELRFTLGEFPEKEFKKQLETKEAAFVEQEGKIEEVARVRQAFLDVLGPEEELGLDDVAASVADAVEGPDEVGEESEEGEDEDAEDEGEEGEEEDGEEGEDDEGSEDGEESEWEDEAPTDEHPVSGDEEEEGGSETLPVTPAPLDEEATHVAEEAPTAETITTGEVPPPPSTPGDATEDATVILARPRLIVMEGGVAIDEFVLGMGTTSIGRGPENVIVLNDDSVSRQHAAVVPTVDGFAICDLRSENGTYVNNERTQEQTLTHGDLIHVGTRTLIFRQR